MTDMDHPDYTKLASVLKAAYDQAARGKGKERHASDGQPFELQPMSAINQVLGSIDGFLYQAAKKAQEARRLPYGRAQAELLGAINYLAGAVIALDTWASGTLPALNDTPLPIIDQPTGAAACTLTCCCSQYDTCTKPCVPRVQRLADADGWIKHDGGPCPVPRGTLVEVRLRDGHIQAGLALHDDGTCTSEPQWTGGDYPSLTIAAYRILPTTN
jgi:hypothetical protein